MLYICDFFARHKEAVSNQIELLAKSNNSTIIAATRFMKQKALRLVDMRDKIYIFPSILYNLVVLLIVLVRPKEPIHYFEEEGSLVKRLLFNLYKRPLYISMYRRPTPDYIVHLKKYKNLKAIFVELDMHKKILLDAGIDKKYVHVTPTPIKVDPKPKNKSFDANDIRLAFASWNCKEKNALIERGLIYLLDLLKHNHNFSLEIALRDNRTKEFIDETVKRGVEDRVFLSNISSTSEVKKMYDRCDFVTFMAQAHIVKAVPNSLIDGLALGKPVIMTDLLDFSSVIKDENLGLVVKAGTPAEKMDLSFEEYDKMKNWALLYSQKHLPNFYTNTINKVYEETL